MQGASGEIRADGCHACGSVWTCPRCAARITEVRGLDLQSGTAAWIAPGNSVAMLTLTAPHREGEALADLWSKLKRAMDSFRGRNSVKTVLKATLGMVRAAEVLHGANGWHPHFHVLIFWRGAITQEQQDHAQQVFARAWIKSAESAGLPAPHPVIGCSLVVGTTCQERLGAYLAKWAKLPTEEERKALAARQWGAERELTKWHTKRGKGESLTPFQLLDVYATGDRFAKARAKSLFIEFSTVMRGQRQLVWSRGLKAALIKLGAVLDDRDDEIVADGAIEIESQVAEVSAEEWRWLVGFKLAPLVMDTLARLPHQSTLVPFLRDVRDRRRALYLQRHMRDPEWSFDLPTAEAV